MRGKLHEMAVGLLNNLKNLPEKVSDPNWMDAVNAEENGEPAKSKRKG